jgi:hypothetical protein
MGRSGNEVPIVSRRLPRSASSSFPFRSNHGCLDLRISMVIVSLSVAVGWGRFSAAVLILFLLLLCFFLVSCARLVTVIVTSPRDKATVVFPAQTMKKGSASLNFVKNYVNIFFMPPGRQGEPLFHCRAEKESTMQRKQ